MSRSLDWLTRPGWPLINRVDPMETYAHGLYTYALFHRRWDFALKASVFSVFPDMPYLITFLVTWGRANLGTRDAFMGGMVYQLSSATHSALFLGGVSLLVLLLRSKTVRPLIIGWGLHIVTDMLTHVGDSTPLLWPLDQYRFPALISYWDPLHYGREFFWINHALLAGLVFYLIFRRLRSQVEGPLAAEGLSARSSTQGAHDLHQ